MKISIHNVNFDFACAWIFALMSEPNAHARMTMWLNRLIKEIPYYQQYCNVLILIGTGRGS